MANPGYGEVRRIHPEIQQPVGVPAAIDTPWFEKPKVDAILSFLTEADELACRAVVAVKHFFKAPEGIKIHGRF